MFQIGGVTIDEFLAKLNLQDGGHHAWRFSRTELGIKAGEKVHVTNNGGEVHSFTEVIAFGTDSIVPPLNAAIPETTPAIPVSPDPSSTFLFPGTSLDVSNLSSGTHKFQCLIHPWMRSVITVAGR